MRNLLLTAFSLFCLTTVFVSCSSDDDNDGVNGGKYENTPYSKLTPEAQKEKLSGDATAFLTEMDGLSTAKSVNVLKAFYGICDVYGAPDLENSPAVRTSIVYINDFYGKYTFNTTTKEWDKSESADKLILSFPVSESSNGEIVATGVASNVTVDEVQLPKELNAKIYLDTKEVGAALVKANITNSESTPLPSSSNVKFVLDSYEFTTLVTKGGTNKASINLSKGSKALIKGDATLVANLDDLLNDDDASSIKDGNVEIAILDKLAAAGKVDFLNLAKDQVAISDSLLVGSSAEAEVLVAIYNKHTNLDLVATKEGTKVAKFVFIPGVVYEYTRWDGSKYTEYGPILALKFDDDTIIEASVYFSEGFDAVLNKATDFINSLSGGIN